MSYDNILSALSHDLRREILALIREFPRSVGELADILPVSQPAISQHLRVLREAALVRMKKEGTRHIYHLDRRGFESLRGYLEDFWEGPLEAYRASFRPGGVWPPDRRRRSTRTSPEDQRKRR